MNRFMIMGLVTLIILVIIFTYNPNGKYLGIYEDKITIDYNIDEGYNLAMELNGKSLQLKNKVVKSNMTSWTFFPKSDGTAFVKFTYRKDNEDKDIYVVTYELKVVKNEIYWVKGDAVGLLDFPNPK